MDGEKAHGPSVLYFFLHPSYPCFVLMSPVTAMMWSVHLPLTQTAVPWPPLRTTAA